MDKQPNLFTRDDTFLGICQGLGEDLGIPPDVLRLSLVPLLFFYPLAAAGAYAAAGLLVLATRLIFPARTAAKSQVLIEEPAAEAIEPTCEPQALAA